LNRSLRKESRFHGHRRRRLAVRRGITLLELMLVLALLVMIGAMSYPALQVPFQMQTLRKGGEVVRVEWSKARIRAMKSGQIQMFTFQPETGSYSIQPYFTEQDVLEADALHSGAGAMGAATATPQMAQQSELESAQPRELPEGVVFATVEVETDLRALQVQQQQLTNPMANMTTMDPNQPPPILFYPDGTTSDAKVVLTNQYQRLYVVVTVRSLTGVVKVSELVTADEIQQVPN
jgi:Tfp pilus assembly protein FimT